MNGIRLLADTNTLIHLLNGNQTVARLLSGKQVCMSVITELELYGKRSMSQSEIDMVDLMVESCFVIDLLPSIKQFVKELRQHYRLKLPDAIVSATALYEGIPLVTFDTDFERVEELNLILLKS